MFAAETVRGSDTRCVYGCRRVAAQLNREGHACSVGLVADLMRELGLTACQPAPANARQCQVKSLWTVRI